MNGKGPIFEANTWRKHKKDAGVGLHLDGGTQLLKHGLCELELLYNIIKHVTE